MRISDWSSDVCSSDLSIEDPRKLSSRCLNDLYDLGCGCLYQAHNLGAQFIERRQRCQRLHDFDVKQGFTHRTADNFKLVVGFREFDGDLCGRYRIRRCGGRCRTSQQIAELVVRGAPAATPGETSLGYLVAGARSEGRRG